MNDAARQRTRMRLAQMGLIKIDWDAEWKMTREGYELLDLLDELRSLDDRPGVPPESSPRRQAPPAGRSGTAATPGGARRGDEVPTARGARRKRT